MKKQVLTMSLLALTAMPASAAINCAVLPTCEELGYNNKTADCDSSNVLKCPFDQTKGKCLGSSSAVVGELSYFATTTPGEGWLLCDGGSYHKDKYPELFAKIGTTFGGGGNIFKVPNYVSGDAFLKPADYLYTSANSGCAPNIKATWYSVYEDKNQGAETCDGALKCTEYDDNKTYQMEVDGSAANGYVKREFDASRISYIFDNWCTAPKPDYYNVPFYIYAGKVGSSTASTRSSVSSCAAGNFYFTDGTCGTTNNASKKVRGFVIKVNKANSSYSYVKFVTGGNDNYAYHVNKRQCQSKGYNGDIAKKYDLEDAKIPGTSYGDFTAINTSRTYMYSKGNGFTCTSTNPTSCSYGTLTSDWGYFYCTVEDRFY